MFDEKAVKVTKTICEEGLLANPDVVDVIVGHKEIGGVVTDELCIVVIVTEKLPVQAVTPGNLIPRTLGSIPTDVICR